MAIHSYRVLYFLLFIFLQEGLALAKPTSYYYRPLGIQEGLSQSRIQCVLNDHKGYLWIGTESGLNCYDRDHVRQYFHQPKDSLTLPTNDITFIAEDSLLNLWVATSNGLCLYNRTKDRFESIRYQMEKRNLYVASCLPVEGGMLFGASGALYKYEYATRKLTALYMTNDPNLYTPFLKMIRYDKNRIFINTQWHGTFFYHSDTRKLEKIKTLPDKNYTSCFMDSQHRLWISAYGNGLFCYQNEQLLKHFTTRNSPLTYDVIHDIIEKDNKLWLATDGGGINILSLNDFSFTAIQQIQDDVHSFPTNTIYRLYKDPMNNIWAGSIRSGLIGIKEVYAKSFQNAPFGNPYGPSNQTVNRFFQDNDGTIWAGTDGGGINQFNPATGTFVHYPASKHEKIASITGYNDHELLLYSFNKGLFIFNKKSGAMRPFLLMDKETNEKSCINGFSVNLQRIEGGRILLSTDSNVYIYDTATKKFSIVATKDKEFHRNSPLIIATTGNRTYLADAQNICEYNDQNGTFRTIYRGNQTINDACMDSDGIFYLASATGLTSYNPKTRKSHSISTSLFHEATSVMSDNQHRIWIGTRHDLYIYTTRTKRFATLGTTDGVMPNEYFFRSMLLTKNGDILIGGTMGMTFVDGNIHFDADVEHTIELLDVFLDGLPVAQEEQIKKHRTIKVPHNFSSLQLKVLLNEKDVFRKNRLKFNISGANQELIKSNSNSVAINHLPIGEYTITAAYYAQNGEWSAPQEILHLVVTPPWWKTYQAYTALLLLLGAMGYTLFHTLQKKKRAKQRQEMERIKNKLYEDKINFLTNISHELRTPLTLVCAPLKRIIDHEVPQQDVESQLLPIYKQAYQMKSIIDMTLDVRRLEEGKEVLHIALYSLNVWIQTVAERFMNEFAAKNIRLECNLSPEIKQVPFDQQKCEFVLSNFLMNALKFSEPGTLTTLSTTLTDDKNAVRISVKDQGMGLGLIHTDSLFAQFVQGSHDKGGSGIGLFYSKSLIDHHKGIIGATDNPDKGATFYYELPLSARTYGQEDISVEKEPLNAISQRTIVSDYSFLKPYSIVIIEDTLDLRSYLKETLSEYFTRVYAAQDGKEGLALIRQKLPDLIISDVMMPRMNGFELCRKVKTDLEISHIPIILLTAYHNQQNMYTGYKIGADAFIPKPFEVDGLLALVHNQLKLREQIKARYKDDKSVSLQEISFSNADETFLLKLNTLITENIGNTELDVNFLASHSGISRSLLFNKVKALTGMGIITYVNNRRIEQAALLMENSSMNLTEISEAVGFSSLRYFSKVFKAIKGTIPSEFNK